MADNQQSPAVLIAAGEVQLLMSPEDVQAFQDWQRLSKDEKSGLLWAARHHKPIGQVVKAWEWICTAGYLIGRVGFLAGVILGVITLWEKWK